VSTEGIKKSSFLIYLYSHVTLGLDLYLLSSLNAILGRVTGDRCISCQETRLDQAGVVYSG